LFFWMDWLTNIGNPIRRSAPNEKESYEFTSIE
jgi:hypothetical protein